ncbi:EF-hand calcium-binding domain-containing protein 1 [Austrofundulus limnaeus]|uniref:EF-hand calcium-binding domain-containing protein 1 n=1 Tax=Austrofundulus limnaeus TaxID=52670 RepID=A0A2I4CAP3_AUSLI|nr:PREDICTED: EF-hand calcium-binding domain-containing protein 1-like [Austrofundulus limnaeus]
MSEMSATNRRKIKDLAKTISKKVEHLNKTETECLILEFCDLLGEKERPGEESHGLDKDRFRGFLFNMFGMTDYMMMDGVFRAFDKDRNGFISLEEWIQGLSVFLRGTLKEKIKHCFRVYDLNGDQTISREEMYSFLKDSFSRLPEEDREEAVKDLVEMAMKRMDTNHDGLVTLEEFEEAVNKEDLLLEAFGPCLPDASRIEKFEQQVFQKELEQ